MNIIMFFFIFLFTGILKCTVGQIEVPIIRTSYGDVQGVFEESIYGQFFLYMGIPFGQPPKDNFFGDPIDPDQWDGVFQADSDESKCPQREELNLTLVGDPNCLTINVYVPANRTSIEPLSVLFWIYGGGFTIGFNNRYMWGPEFLIRHDIIMVAVNYRLGPYGFMCLRTPKVPGNAGMKDLLKGIRWVKENIAAFGGNPDSITAGGSSAGAIAVEYLLCSSTNSNLFNRGIFQSGTGIMQLENTMKETSHLEVLKLAEYLGYKSGSLTGSVQFLQSVHHYDVLLAVEALELSFKACEEPEIQGVERFFAQNHFENLISGNYPNIEVLFGFNNEEYPYFPNITESGVLDLLNDAISLLKFENEESKSSIANILRNFYLGTQPISEDIRQDLANLNSDYSFTHAVFRQLYYFKQKNITLYFYEFGYDGGRNFNKYKGNYDWNGAMHADEIGYIFNQGLYDVEPDENDALIIDRTTLMWANFVKYGNPTPEINDLLPVRWLPVENGVNNYLKINTEMVQAVDPNQNRMAFWDLLMEAYMQS